MDFPDWTGFTPEFAAAELPRLLDEAEKAVAAIEAAGPKAYEDFVWPLDDATRGLWRCWGMVAHMLGVMNSEAWRKVEEAWQPKIVAFGLRVSQSARLYELAKAVRNRQPPTAGVRCRILDKMVQSAELAGVGLEGAEKERFNEIQMRLAKLGMDFANAVLDATKAFSFEKGGEVYTIDDAAYPETMKHCADREVRERLCRARATRAPGNAELIDEILMLRRESAALLGYPDAVAVSLATKCAPSVEAVRTMIGALDAATAASAAKEDEALTALAHRENPSLGALQPWDFAYFAERLRERTYSYSEEELKRHFELDDVLKGLFRLTNELFGAEVVEMTGDARPSVWHEDVRFFAVKENGETVANFYFDPFVRSGLKSGGAWMNEFRNRREDGRGTGDRGAVTPLAVVVTNFPERNENGKCCLPFREVETLFHEFGHALQCMLTRVGEEDAAGINLVEWDAVEVASQFMENWCLDDRTGIAVPAGLKAKVRAAQNFRAASACRRQLAFARLDLDLHAAGFAGDPDALKRETFAHFGLPSVEGDLFLNSFTHIFAGGYAAGYYSYKWSEVMSADCYGAFEEAGLDDDAAMRATGRRYRETVLALGGSRSALEVFRAFRGRNPEIAALLRQRDLTPPKAC